MVVQYRDMILSAMTGMHTMPMEISKLRIKEEIGAIELSPPETISVLLDKLSALDQKEGATVFELVALVNLTRRMIAVTQAEAQSGGILSESELAEAFNLIYTEGVRLSSVAYETLLPMTSLGNIAQLFENISAKYRKV